MQDPSPRASIIIPSYNSRDTILDCLRALLTQDPVQPLEIIVVDSSNDGTADLIEAECPEVELVRLPRRTHAGIGRNIGAERARGDILAFTDADCLPAPDWLENVLRNQVSTTSQESGEAPREAIVAGSIDNGTPESLVGTADWLIEFSNAFPGLPQHDVTFAATANFSLSRELFLSTPGFDDSRTGQDMVFGKLLHELGYRIRFDSKTRVAHRNRVRLLHFFRRQYQLGYGSAYIRRELPLHGHWIAKVPPLVPALLPYRLFQVVKRSLRANRRTVLSLLKTAPLIVAGLGAWTTGFLAGTVGPRPSHGDTGATAENTES